MKPPDWFSLFVLFVEPFKTVGENIAFGKYTAQSSLQENGMGEASRAVDGSTASNWNDGSCTHTDNDNQYWWSVDLGAVYRVDTVRIYNRADTLGWKLNNFYVGVSRTNPEEVAPDPGNYEQCYFYNGAFPASATLPCGSCGRYVIIQLSTASDDGVLTLCEVEITGREGWIMQPISGLQPDHVIRELEVRSKRVCAMHCHRESNCRAFKASEVGAGRTRCELKADSTQGPRTITQDNTFQGCSP